MHGARKSLLALGAASLISMMAVCGSAAAGVVGHYSFDADATTDSSGNGLNLNSQGSLNLVAGQFGSAVNIDGGEYLWSANSAFNVGSGDFALSFWYTTDGSPNGGQPFQPLVGKSNSGADAGYGAWMNASSVAGDVNDTSGGSVGASRPGDDTTAFQHIVLQRAGSTLELYVNGLLADTDAVTAFTESTGTAFTVGARNITNGGGAMSGTLYFDGRIDELWVFDNALGGAEITNLRDNNSLAAAVPEPESLALLGMGVLLLGSRLRRRNGR